MTGGEHHPIRVAIIGAGLGGIAAAVKLRKRTPARFVIFEQSSGVGGTWFDNRYPGCEVDVPSHAYSYSFLKYDWPRTHATQPELLAYAEHVVERFGLTPYLRLNTRVTDLVWEESTSTSALSRLARAGQLRRPVLPHLALGGPRPHRQVGRGGRHRIDRRAGRAGDRAGRR
jgi:cation diffusion facilitator CzcD-associated flavoprotein CzcO